MRGTWAWRGAGWAAPMAWVAGCAPDLSEKLVDDYDPPAGQAPMVDASSEEAWAAYDLDAGAAVDEAEPGWDLRFQRVKIEMNAGVEAVVLDGADYEALTEAPADGWREDTPEDPVFLTWYDYDYATHVVSPADRVYVVHTTDGVYVKLRFLTYYDEAGTSGMYSFDHEVVDPPGGA